MVRIQRKCRSGRSALWWGWSGWQVPAGPSCPDAYSDRIWLQSPSGIPRYGKFFHECIQRPGVLQGAIAWVWREGVRSVWRDALSALAPGAITGYSAALGSHIPDDLTTVIRREARQGRRGGRVVDRAALEMRSTGNRTGGSNPSLSAIICSRARRRSAWAPHLPRVALLPSPSGCDQSSSLVSPSPPFRRSRAVMAWPCSAWTALRMGAAFRQHSDIA